MVRMRKNNPMSPKKFESQMRMDSPKAPPQGKEEAENMKSNTTLAKAVIMSV